jgi:hypothetical protein
MKTFHRIDPIEKTWCNLSLVQSFQVSENTKDYRDRPWQLRLFYAPEEYDTFRFATEAEAEAAVSKIIEATHTAARESRDARGTNSKSR